jgi:urease accessory protein
VAATIPTITAAMTTTTPTELLQLLWLASPTLPVGAFSYSEGLEAAVDAGLVHDEATAGDWLLNQLELVQARAELPLQAAAFRAEEQALVPLNAWVLQTRESAELLQQCTQMGRSLCAWMTSQGLAPPELKPPTWPVVYARAARQRGTPLEPMLHAAAFAWAENLVMAAVRAVPLGQSAGQRLLGRLVEAIPAAVEQALAAEEALAFSPGLACLSARHETQYSRLFRS